MIMAVSGLSAGEDNLRFNPGADIPERILEVPDGTSVRYRSYERLYYVTHIVDSAYQYLNIYVPETAYEDHENRPVFLKTNVGGYRAGKVSQPSVRDATGFALQKGYVVVVAGSRGSDSRVTTPSGEVYTGRAPAGLVDLKAAVRYLRHNADVLPGNMERIITDGTSAGGAMSSLLGATGNHPAYEPYLQELGAAPERDDIFAAVCFCPITDLDHADMAYEWLYNRTNRGVRNLTAEEMAVSDQLAAMYPFYLNGLGLETPDGTLLTDKNYLDYMSGFLIVSAQKGLDAGMNMPANAGIILNEKGDLVLDIDMDRYLAYVAGRQN